MKKLLFVLLAAGLFSCQAADKPTEKELTQEQKENATKDSANFTTIQWLDSTYRDLGKVKEGQVVEVSFRFKNSGTKNLVIANVTASCGCTVPEKPEKPFAPGEEGVIKAKFDSKGRPHGEARKEVFVTANTSPEPLTPLSFRVEITD
ncbi:DUF1573 domain-containing protein [Terrimonas pollutisoli]|uniref:DUF1573 domain-containing protein n=1 Tax=Terrimonas pollutisoli TaxID=3034147 RepID=UPI0023EC6CC8|nr:DUF1573 domain-containing protein [Terrimonas sp. H1YJ31]